LPMVQTLQMTVLNEVVVVVVAPAQ